MLRTFLGALVLTCVSSVAMAQTALYPPLAPGPFTSTNVSWNYNMGYMFTPNKNITVTQLGGAFYGTKTVYLYNNTTNAVLGSAVVTGGGTSYAYANITPIVLSANTTYAIGVWLAGSGGNYYSVSFMNAVPTSNNDVTINDGCYVFNSTANPCTGTGTFAALYGVPDLKYTGGSGLGCREITGPGYYTLMGDIQTTATSGTASNCLYIHDFAPGPNTTIDCQGHSIRGGSDSSAQGNGNAILFQNINNNATLTVKNCLLDSSGVFPVSLVSATSVTVSKSTIGSVARGTFGVKVRNSSSLSINSNTIYGMVDVSSSTGIFVTQNQVICSTGSIQPAGIGFGDGSYNTASGNVITGNWNGGAYPNVAGCDDGVVIAHESYTSVTDNNISGCWDVAIETAGLIQSSHIDNNILSNIPATASGAGAGSGIGGWYSMGFINTSFTGNVVDSTGRGILWFSPTTDNSGPYTFFHFENNLFAYNTLTNHPGIDSDYFAGPSVPSSFVSAPVAEGGNVFTGNNWGPNYCPPEFVYYPVPSGNVIDGGNNVCTTTIDCGHAGQEPIQCHTGPSCSGWQYDAGGGLGCWYTGAVGQTCNTVCASHGGFNATTSTHSGNRAGRHFKPLKTSGSNWMSVECSSTDNNTNWGASGGTADGGFSHTACMLSCSCNN